MSYEYTSSDDSAVRIDNNEIAKVYRGDTNKDVTITLTFTKGNGSASIGFTVTVKKTIKTTVEMPEPTSTTVAGVTTFSTNVTYGGLSELGITQMEFVVIKTNTVTGEITGRGSDIITINPSATIDNTESIPVSASVGECGSGEEIKYYLWDKNHVSLIDKAPSKISGLTATPKAKGVELVWEDTYDDSGIAPTYNIYRDNEDVPIDTNVSGTRYLVGSARLDSTHSYRVVPVDNRGSESVPSKSIKTEANTLLEWIYINSLISSIDQGLKLKERTNNTGDSQGIIVAKEDNSQYLNAGRQISYFTTGEYVSAYKPIIYFEKPNTILRDERDLVFEIMYYDHGKNGETDKVPITFVYNSALNGNADATKFARKEVAIPSSGREGWRFIAIRVTDAELRNSENSSRASFGFMMSNGLQTNVVAIHKVSVTRYNDYGIELEAGIPTSVPYTQ